MSSCAGLDAKALRESREFYNRLFGAALGWYNANVHTFVYQPLCVLGVLANVCVVVVLLRAPMRRNPFNLFLIAIALCDMTLMATYFIYKRVEMCHPWYFEYGWIVFTYAYAVLSVYVHSASLWITVNMAVLRYLVLRNSASSNSSMPKLNTYAAASVAIASAVLISLIGSAPNMLRYEIRDNGMSVVPAMCLANNSAYADYYTPDQRVHAYTLGQPTFWSCRWERLSFWTAGLMLKLIPCLLLTIFMTLLVRMLMEARERRLRLCQRGGAKIASIPNETTAANGHTLPQTGGAPTGKAQMTAPAATAPSSSSSAANAERTTAMLTIIVAVFLVTELPQGILVMTIGVQPQLHNLIDLLSLLNSSVNFILYSTMSNLFRNEFLRTFGQLCICARTHLCASASPPATAGRRRSSQGRLFGWLCCGCDCDANSRPKVAARGRLTSRAARECTSGAGIVPSAATAPPTVITTVCIEDGDDAADGAASRGCRRPIANGGAAMAIAASGVTADVRTPLIHFHNGVIDVALDESGETVLC